MINKMRHALQPASPSRVQSSPDTRTYVSSLEKQQTPQRRQSVGAFTGAASARSLLPARRAWRNRFIPASASGRIAYWVILRGQGVDARLPGGTGRCLLSRSVPLSSRKPRAIRWRWLLPVVVLVAAFHFSAFSRALDRSFLDVSSRHPLRPLRVPANSAFVLVDEQTMAALSQQGLRWPYPRAIFAQLVAALPKSGAAHVMVDFTFFEESDGAQDQLLAAVAAASPSVVLARTEERPPVFWSDAYQSAHPRFFQKPRTGFVEFPADEDGVAHEVYVAPGSLAAAGFRSSVRHAWRPCPLARRTRTASVTGSARAFSRALHSRRPAHDRADRGGRPRSRA